MEVITCSIVRFPDGSYMNDIRKNGIRCSHPSEDYDPSVAIYDRNGKAIELLYYKDNGVLWTITKRLNRTSHCEYGPSELRWYDNGCIEYIHYLMNDVSYSDSTHPSSVHFYENNHIEAFYWEHNMRNGSYHYPSSAEYHPNGYYMSIEYSVGYKLFHRPDHPAEFRWDENGELQRVGYHLDGKKHNVNGPAIMHWHTFGTKRRLMQEYWINGVQIKHAKKGKRKDKG